MIFQISLDGISKDPSHLLLKDGRTMKALVVQMPSRNHPKQDLLREF